MQGRPPNVEQAMASGGLMQCFIGMAGNFCRYSDSSSDGLQLCGKDAAIARFEAAKKAAPTRKLTLAECEPLIVFNWMLSKAQALDVGEFVASAISSARGTSVRLKCKTSPVSQDGANDVRGKKAKRAAADVDVDSLFS